MVSTTDPSEPNPEQLDELQAVVWVVELIEFDMRLTICVRVHRAQAAPASIEQRTVQQHTSLGDSDESDEAVSPTKVFANV